MSDSPVRGRRSRWVRIALVVVAVLVSVPVLAGSWALSSFSRLRGRTLPTPENVGFEELAAGSFDPAEAERMYRARGCADCHGDSGTGEQFIDDPGLGKYVGANITRGQGGVPADFGPADFDAAVRHCVGVEGRPLLIMPCRDYTAMGDHDLALICAHVQSLRAADAERVHSPTLLGRILIGAGVVPWFEYDMIDHTAIRAEVPPVGATVEYGQYVANACIGCHGEHFSGGPLPGAPPSLPVPQNLTQHETGLQGWTREQFATAVRTGTRPDGTTIDPFMPTASSFGHFNDTEIDALWAFVQSLPPRPEGDR